MQHLPEDIDIIRTVLAGRQQAYSLLVDRYQKYVFALALRYVSDRELAEELAQDVFIKAYRSLADYRGDSKFSTWLYTIVHTVCISALRKKPKPVTLVEDIAAISLAAENSTYHYLDVKANKAMINSALDQLEPVESEVLTLFYLAGQSLEEIGRITGQTTGNIKVRLFRARQRLKQVLLKQYAVDAGRN